MKKFIHTKFWIAIGIASLSIISFSCDPDGDSVGVSTITYFPSFELVDGESVVIEVGDEFVPDAIVKEGENELTPVIDNGVDSDVPGIYSVLYSAVNSDGYTGSATQEVVVYDPSIVPTDVRGNIVDVNNSSRTGTITLVPGTTNLFLGSDMAFGGVFPLYFQMDGDEMTVIPQPFPSAFGVSGVEASYNPATKRFSVLILPQGFAYTFQLSQ
jgi:hypothetical protein